MNDQSAVAVVEAPKPPSRGAMSPAELLSMAMERGASLDMIERLLALRDKEERNDARRAFSAAISLAKAKIKPVLRTRQSHNGKYADLASIQEHIDPILGEHGLSYRWRTTQPDKATMVVTCIVEHAAGHSEETTLTSGLDNTGNKTPVQMIGSTATYLQRYTLNAAMGLSAAHDDDGNGGGGGRANAPAQDRRPAGLTAGQLSTLEGLLTSCVSDRAGFLKAFGATSVSDFPPGQYDRAIDVLKGRAQKLAAEKAAAANGSAK
jgi:ERF superfamily